jgi:anti-sigma factor RsiW
MKPERIDESFLVKYLLGDLSPDEEIQVEDRAFADADYLAALETAEADLIDSYVRGQLSQTDRRRFERRFLASPQRRRKVAFARDLAKVTAEIKASTTAPAQSSSWDALVRLIQGWSPAFQFATAFAALALVTVTAWLVIDNTSMRSRMATLESRQRDTQSKADEFQRQLNEEQAHTKSLIAQVQEQQTKSTPASAIASLILLPGLSRAENRREQLSLNTSTQIARIEIQLEPRDNYPRFRAELRTARGDEVLVRSNLQRIRTAAGGSSVVFEVPSSALDSGEYELALKGISNDQSVQDIGFHYFTVQKP